MSHCCFYCAVHDATHRMCCKQKEKETMNITNKKILSAIKEIVGSYYEINKSNRYDETVDLFDKKKNVFEIFVVRRIDSIRL